MRNKIILLLIVLLLVVSGCSKFPGTSPAPSVTIEPTPIPSASPVETSAPPDETPAPPESPMPSNQQQTDEEYSADGIGAVKALKEALSATDDPRVNEELIRLFYDYYSRSYDKNNHVNELRLLPPFEEGKAPDWDDFLVFAFEFSNPVRKDNGEYFMSEESVEKTLQRFFPEFEHTHQETDMFSYTGEGYIPKGYDLLGSYYYRLTDISRDADGVFTAQFDGFALQEEDLSEPRGSSNLSKNGRAVYEAAGDIEYFTDRQTFDKVMLQIFNRPDYQEILQRDVKITIKFRLSDSPNDAFIYLACSKEYKQTT